MRSSLVLCLCLSLLVAASQANFYGKRAMEGKGLKELIQDMRLQQQVGAEDIVDQIEQLIKEYRAARPRVLRNAEIDN